MRIVHIVEAFGGGVLSMVTELCNRTAATGAQVTVLYSDRPETPANFAALFDPRVDLVRVPMCREVSLRNDWLSVRQLAEQLRRCEPTVVHLHSSKAGVLGRAAAELGAHDAKVLYSPHGLAFLRSDVSRVRQFAYLTFERIAALMGGTVVACSRGELDEIEKKVRVRDVRLIENGVNIDSIRSRRERDDDDVVIGMNGRASFQKNHELFIAAAAALHNSRTRFLWIGGDIADLPASAANSAITCSGWVTRSRALDLMAGLDIYVQTSRWEGMPVALIEAQAAGIPAVVTNVVGNRDVVVHGTTGFVASSTDELYAHVAHLRRDRALRQRMGNAARQWASAKFSMDTIFHKWLDLYGASAEIHEKTSAWTEAAVTSADETVET